MSLDTSAIFKLGYGVYIVSSMSNGKINGQIATTVIQVTSNPIQITAVINKGNLTHDYIVSSNVFGISVLEKDVPLPIIGSFGFKSGRDIDKFKNINYELSEIGTPLVIDNAVAVLEAKVTKNLDLGTHTLFIGEVFNSKHLSDKETLTYDYYHNVKKLKSPPSAPTYSA
jgi:ferric-chelate reductase [NAD(P)H]